jgi:hypothetical protein
MCKVKYAVLECRTSLNDSDISLKCFKIVRLSGIFYLVMLNKSMHCAV